MAANQNFRNAFNGFNKEDVLHYIEYLNSKNAFAMNQLKSENQSLMAEVEQLRAEPKRDPDLEQQCASVQAENESLQEQLCAMEQEVARLKGELAAAEQKAANRVTSEELEAYRRAERMERAAQERTQQIYRQVTGTLAETATQVDEAANEFKRLSQEMDVHMAQMQDMVDRSRNALLNASATMYSIRPMEAQEE